MAKKLVEAITSMDEDFAQWYTDVVKKAELADYIENELHDTELLQMKADIVKDLLKSLAMEKEKGDR